MFHLDAMLTALSKPLVSRLTGRASGTSEEMWDRLSPGAKDLIDKAMDGISPGAACDYHGHMLGLGHGGTGAWVNPNRFTWAHPVQRFSTMIYLAGAGVTDTAQMDGQYVDRLLRLIRSVPNHGKMGLLAFDYHYGPEGHIDLNRSDIYTPNAYVVALSAAHPDAFFPMISVHPYRDDALEELDNWADKGVGFVKWLPNAQGMNPADPKCEPFYQRMIDHGMALLTHAGEEQAVGSNEHQHLGNPLLFRRPLDMGLKVIMAHGASLGDNEDLDRPGARATNFDLLIRLMETPAYRENLFADISAMANINHPLRPLMELLRREDLHERLINGSDYPLPSIKALARTTTRLQKNRLITGDEKTWLDEVYGFNPLLFDTVMKRCLRHPQSHSTFPAALFCAHPKLPKS